MPSGPDAGFTVDRLPQIDEQIGELAKTAKTRGILSEYVSTLNTILDKLERDPLGWGDPEYHAKSKGSIVCHGVFGPLFVKYVVFEPERAVIILQLRAMPSAGLD